MTLQYRSAVDVAADVIRHRIHSGQLQAGATVRIKDLAAEMALSTTPVRDALKVLEREGLMRIAARSGVHVRSISVDEVLEVYAVKQSLEPLMVRWAVMRASDEEIQALVDLARKLAALAREQRLDEYVELIEERQRLLLAMARSDVLSTIFQAIDGRVRLMRYRNLAQPGRVRRSVLEHEQLARAIERRDVDLVSQLSARYVSSATRSLLELIRDSGDTEVHDNPLSWPPPDGSTPNTGARRPRRSSPERRAAASPGGAGRRAGSLSIASPKGR